MITQEEAIQLWNNYSGRNYIYKSGKFQGKVVKAKGWELRGGELYIEMSDGQLIDQRNFSSLLSNTNKQVIINDTGVSPQELYNSGGEKTATEIPKIQPKYNIPDLDPTFDSSNYNNQKTQKQKTLNPIHSILEKAPKAETATIPIEIKVDIVNDEVLKLLELTFPDESFKETILYYKDKINIESIQNAIEYSLAKYLKPKFNTVTDDQIDEFEDGIEGTLIEE